MQFMHYKQKDSSLANAPLILNFEEYSLELMGG